MRKRKEDEGKLVRLPRYFYDDHEARALPTPTAQRLTSRNVWVRRDDPNLPELVDDARHYATDVDSAPVGIIIAAQAVLRAVERKSR